MSLPDLAADVAAVLAEPWNDRDGTVVPTPADVTLQGGAVRLDATMLYADLADSTTLVGWDKRVAARIFKAFLVCCTKLILHRGGHVRSFDGDRVMGVFVGANKNTKAVRCALNIHYAFQGIIRPKLEGKYPKIKDGTYSLDFCVGIDTGSVLVVRSGVRGNNDLLWVGAAANIAAKLSSLRESPYRIYITKPVYDVLHKSSKFASDDVTSMWEARTWNSQSVYRSHYRWGE